MHVGLKVRPSLPQPETRREEPDVSAVTGAAALWPQLLTAAWDADRCLRAPPRGDRARSPPLPALDAMARRPQVSRRLLRRGARCSTGLGSLTCGTPWAAGASAWPCGGQHPAPAPWGHSLPPAKGRPGQELPVSSAQPSAAEQPAAGPPPLQPPPRSEMPLTAIPTYSRRDGCRKGPAGFALGREPSEAQRQKARSARGPQVPAPPGAAPGSSSGSLLVPSAAPGQADGPTTEPAPGSTPVASQRSWRQAGAPRQRSGLGLRGRVRPLWGK